MNASLVVLERNAADALVADSDSAYKRLIANVREENVDMIVAEAERLSKRPKRWWRKTVAPVSRERAGELLMLPLSECPGWVRELRFHHVRRAHRCYIAARDMIDDLRDALSLNTRIDTFFVALDQVAAINRMIANNP